MGTWFRVHEPVPDFDVIAPALDFDFVVPALDFGFVEVADVGLVLGLVDVYKVELGFGVTGLYLAVGLGLDVGLSFGLRFVDVVEVASASSTCIIFLPLFCMFSRLLRRSSFPPHTPLDAQPTFIITYFFSIRILIRSCVFPAARGLVAPHTSHESNLLPWGVESARKRAHWALVYEVKERKIVKEEDTSERRHSPYVSFITPPIRRSHIPTVLPKHPQRISYCTRTRSNSTLSSSCGTR